MGGDGDKTNNKINQSLKATLDIYINKHYIVSNIM